jgi:hypothetical protein
MINYGQVFSTAPYAGGLESTLVNNRLKMKKTLKQKFRDWLFDENKIERSRGIAVDEDSIQLSRERSIKFEIHSANGGRVVQTRRYDAQKDRHFENLYIITGEQDFGREIDKIITMEALR